MTNGNGNNIEARLSAMERQMNEMRDLLQATVLLQHQTADNINRLEAMQTTTQQVVDSNARAIQAWENRINQVEADAEEDRSRLRVDLSAVQATIAQTAELQQTLLQVQLQDRQQWQQQRNEINQQIQAWQQQRNEINQQIQALIDTQNQDRLEAREQRSEINQQIQSLIDLSRQNTQAHAEFRTDIRHIWERLDG